MLAVTCALRLVPLIEAESRLGAARARPGGVTGAGRVVAVVRPRLDLDVVGIARTRRSLRITVTIQLERGRQVVLYTSTPCSQQYCVRLRHIYAWGKSRCHRFM